MIMFRPRALSEENDPAMGGDAASPSGQEETLGREKPAQEIKEDVQREILIQYARSICRYGIGLDMKSLITGLEQILICGALEATLGNQRKAARLLGLKYTTLNEKLRRFSIRSVAGSFGYHAKPEKNQAIDSMK